MPKNKFESVGESGPEELSDASVTSLFDPEKEIKKEDWKNIKEELEDRRHHGSWSDFSERAMAMKILDPSQEFDLDDKAWNGMKEEMEKLRSNSQHSGDWLLFSKRAMSMKIIDPLKFNLDQRTLDSMRVGLEKFRRNSDWFSFLKQAMAMKILDPSQEFNLDQKAWDNMKDELHRDKVDFQMPGLHGFKENFSNRAMAMKILDPSQELDLDQEAWGYMKAQLERHSYDSELYNGSWLTFFDEAAAMKILAAKKVEVPKSGGLKVEM